MNEGMYALKLFIPPRNSHPETPDNKNVSRFRGQTKTHDITNNQTSANKPNCYPKQ